MKRRLKKVFVAAAIACVLMAVLYAVLIVYSGYKYNAYVEQVPAACEPVVESERLVELRQEVADGQWRRVGSGGDEPDEIKMGDTLEALGYSRDMDGATAFFGEELPAFDYYDVGSMERPVTLAGLRAVLSLGSDDGIYHLNESGSVAIMFFNDTAATYVRTADDEVYTGAMINITKHKSDPIDGDADAKHKPLDDYAEIPFEL